MPEKVGHWRCLVNLEFSCDLGVGHRWGFGTAL